MRNYFITALFAVVFALPAFAQAEKTGGVSLRCNDSVNVVIPDFDNAPPISATANF